jgi:hypothetical protein
LACVATSYQLAGIGGAALASPIFLLISPLLGPEYPLPNPANAIATALLTEVFGSASGLLSRYARTDPKEPRVRLVWHRRDLCLHDDSLYSNLEEGTSVGSPFVFDDKDFQPRPSTCNPNEWDAVTVGPHAARILFESVQDLRQSLRSIGGELLI